MVKHCTVLLQFKPKNWVMCHKPVTLEEVIGLMEAYASAESGLYLILKVWGKRGEGKAGIPGRGGGPMSGQ